MASRCGLYNCWCGLYNCWCNEAEDITDGLGDCDYCCEDCENKEVVEYTGR